MSKIWRAILLATLTAVVLSACAQDETPVLTEQPTAEVAEETDAEPVEKLGAEPREDTVETIDESAAEPTAESVDVEADADSSSETVAETPDAFELTANPWQWVAFTNPVEQFDVETPESYLLLFQEDGSLIIAADCNNALGSYTDEDGALSIDIGPTTLAMCPPESRSDEFLNLLPFAARYFFADGHLFIDLMADGGTFEFAPADAALFADYAAGAPAQEAGSALPPAEIANDEGGPATVNGEWAYTSSYVGRHYTEPVALLKDVSDIIQGNYTEWVPPSGQIMGVLTRPLAPSPTAYAVNLPVEPSGKRADLDNDGQEDAGIQILAGIIGSNIAGDSYLEQIEQDVFTTYLTDPLTGVIREGTFLVYAGDDQQGFPSGAGDDGLFFTADDPAVALPAGYTHVTLSEDGQVTFDRSREVSMPILEAASFSSPDFSDQGIVESYESLIALLTERYSYTDLRGLDWDAIREEYLPAVEAADEAGSLAAYYAALNKLALSIRDAHVYVNSLDPSITADAFADFDSNYSGNLGAKGVELSDGRFVIVYVAPDSPAAEAGWQAGTEIISVDGMPIAERVEGLPVFESAGNPEAIRLNQANIALNFPAGAETTIEYRGPDEEEVQTATLTAVSGAAVEVPAPAVPEESISFRQLEDGSYYVQWQSFDDELYKMAIFEKFLNEAQAAPGIIIDMRHNGGGSVAMLYTMASYFFSAEEPAALHWLDEYTYDDQAGDLVQELATDYPLSSPKPDLTYEGAVAVLVGPNSASAAEYMPQFLQQQGRAIVVGEYGTEGAGGAVEFVTMPGGFNFLFTKGRTYFAGTDELNLEQKGVELDVRVPLTLENELAKQEGRDVVLEAAVAALGEEAARLISERIPGTTWQLQNYIEAVAASSTFINEEIADPASYTVTFEDDGQMSIQADCNMATAEYSLGSAGAINIEVGPATLAACAEGSLSENFINALGEINTIQSIGDQLALQLTAENGDTILMVLQQTASTPADAEENAPSADAEDEDAAVVAEPPNGTAAPIPLEALRSATYSGVYEEPVTLTDGLYQGEPFTAGDPARPTVEYVDGAELFGDLDGDGLDDAVVFLLESSGGTGIITYLAAQLNDNGQPRDAGAVRIDEVQVKSAGITDGRVALEIITMGPGDGDCCPTHKAQAMVELQDDRLVEIAVEDGQLEQLSAADLAGTGWTLLELDEDQPVAPGSDVTINFADGQISGSGGCNSFDGRFTLGEDNPLVMTLEILPTTLQACSEPVVLQETAYFTALNKVSQWAYRYGQLALYYLDEQTGRPARLLFSPALESPENENATETKK